MTINALSLTTICENDVATVAIGGHVTASNRALLAAQLNLARGYHPTRVVVDLAQCDSIDSSGLGVIIGGAKKCREEGIELAVRGLNPDLVELFKQTKVDAIVKVEDAEAAHG